MAEAKAEGRGCCCWNVELLLLMMDVVVELGLGFWLIVCAKEWSKVVVVVVLLLLLENNGGGGEARFTALGDTNHGGTTLA